MLLFQGTVKQDDMHEQPPFGLPPTQKYTIICSLYLIDTQNYNYPISRNHPFGVCVLPHVILKVPCTRKIKLGCSYQPCCLNFVHLSVLETTGVPVTGGLSIKSVLNFPRGSA